VTKEQFVRRRAEFQKRDRRFNILYLVSFFGLLILAVPLSSHIPKAYNTAFVVGYLVLLAINAVIMVWFGQNQAKRAGLVCYSCKGGLLNTPGNIAMATGNCPHCGKRAFAGSA
jgi:hypothetical protein